MFYFIFKGAEGYKKCLQEHGGIRKKPHFCNLEGTKVNKQWIR